MATPIDNFSGADLDLTRRELSSAFNLPPDMYTSEAIFAAERKAIFSREWIYVCRADQIANSGDYWTKEIAGAPLVIVRDKDGAVRAHSSVCRHKGAIIVEGHGNAKAFRCHYHGWTYGLDGKLVAAPLMNKSKDFSRCEFGLISVAAEVWEGLVFVNLDAHAPSLQAKLAPLSGRFTDYRLGDMVCTSSLEYETATNWKLYVANGMEEYHIPVAHAKTLEPIMPMRDHVTEPPGGYYEILSIARAFGDSPLPRIANFQGNTTITALIYPNLIVSATPDSFYTFDHQPIDASQTRVKIDIFFPRSTAARADFAEHARAYHEGLDVIIQEDNVALASTYKGLSSPLSRRGRYAFREQIVHRLDNYVLNRLGELS
jgi:choline monooxygenase